MSPHTPGPDYAADAFRACQQGNADANQQRSVACDVILLNARKGELLRALTVIAETLSALDEFANLRHIADAAIAKATNT
jgi:hypothetical protein